MAGDKPDNLPARGDDEADGGPKLKRANPLWELRLIIAACVVGGVLLAIGLWGEIAVTLDGIMSTTFIVSGLALIFGAFGSQATVRYKGWVVAGVAATALIFLFAIDYLRSDSYVIVQLRSPKEVTTTISAGNAIIKGTVQNGPLLRTRFIVFYRELGDSNPEFVAEWPKANDRSENPTVLICLARERLIRWFGRGDELDWQLHTTGPLDVNTEIRDDKSDLIGSSRECGSGAESPPSTVRAPDLAESRAHAEQASDVDTLIEDLLSENPDVRRLARDRLAGIGPNVIRRLMDRALGMAAANERLALRMQTGVAIVLDTMLIKNAASSADVGRQLNASDFNALVTWTVNRDLSLRDPAVRVVANTADIAALRSLMRAVEHEIDAAIIYNTAWILRRSAQRLRSNASVLAEIKQLARTLRPRASNANTTQLLDQIEAM